MERFKYISLAGGKELYGNPKLDPEQSVYGEYGLHYDNRPFRVDLRLFANIITNYIAEKQISPTRSQLENVDDARIVGAELEGRWQFLDNWGLYGSATALYGRDMQKDQALPGVAPVSGKLGVDFNYQGFWARAEGRGIAPQRDTPKGVDHTDGVVTLHAALGYSCTTGALRHNLSLALDNIADARYYNYLAHQRGYTVWEPGFAASLNYSVEF
jgi:hemoglobin/transferrin/lactoferrin receptor protein